MADAMLSYYMGIPNPEELSDEAWALKFKCLQEIRKKEARR